MKKILYLCAVLVFVACKKEPVHSVTGWEKYLSDSDKVKIDFTRYSISKQKSKWYWKYQLGKELLLLQSDTLGNYEDGRIIYLIKNTTNPLLYNGSITIQTLQRKLVVQAAIENGSIAVSSQRGMREQVIPGNNYLPEVIVTGYYPSSSGGLSFSTFLALHNLMTINGSNPATQPDHDGSPVIYSPLGSSPPGDNPGDISINYEGSYNNPAIDMNAWMMCFGMLLDAGSQCSVTLYCDLPVDNDPQAVYNWYTGATGHVFMELSKTRGDQSISQVIGFTATSPFSVFGPADHVPAKTVDNGGHKYSASLKINVTPAGLQQIIEQAKTYTANYHYNITSFNCIQYVLGAINTVMGNDPIKMPIVQNSGPYMPLNSPVYLYQQLEAMKHGGDPLAANIHFDGTMHAGKSHGPCN